MSQLQHSLTGEWHRPDCSALTKQEHIECDCPEFDFYDVNLFIESPGEGYYFHWGGAEYVVECWATRNASGQDIYSVEDGEPIQLEEDVDERFDAALEEIREKWQSAWVEHVAPAIETAKEAVFGGA